MQIDIDFRERPNTVFGVKVYVTQDVPKMQLSARVCEVLAPEFIVETNAWMRSFFGMTNSLADGEYAMDHWKNQCWMNPRTYEQFKKQFKKV